MRIVAPFASRGSNDVFARAVADRLPAVLGQPVIDERRAGACSATGPAQTAHAAPDAPPAPEPTDEERTAEQEKALGSQAFKDENWQGAVAHFTAANELPPKPVPPPYYRNRSAVTRADRTAPDDPKSSDKSGE